jgi:hypothetical protein
MPDGEDARVHRRRHWENSAEAESMLARGRDLLREGKEAPENALGENLRRISVVNASSKQKKREAMESMGRAARLPGS